MESMVHTSAAKHHANFQELLLEKDAATMQTLTSTTHSLAESIIASTSTFSKKLFSKFDRNISEIHLQLQALRASAGDLDACDENSPLPGCVSCENSAPLPAQTLPDAALDSVASGTSSSALAQDRVTSDTDASERMLDSKGPSDLVFGGSQVGARGL